MDQEVQLFRGDEVSFVPEVSGSVLSLPLPEGATDRDLLVLEGLINC